MIANVAIASLLLAAVTLLVWPSLKEFARQFAQHFFWFAIWMAERETRASIKKFQRADIERATQRAFEQANFGRKDAA